MRDRLCLIAVVCAALCVAGCSSGSSFNTANLNPFTDGGCAPPCDPQPVCAPPCETQPTGQRPPEARPGEVWCYVRVPAVTETYCEQVCVQPERCDKRWVEPVTRDVCEQICTAPEQTLCRKIPAEFEDLCEQVCTAPARTEWRRVDCEAKESLKPQEQIGECWTLVEIPPCYEQRTRRICTCPEKTVQDVIPAKFEQRTRTEVVTAGYYQTIPIPAVFETVSKERVICGPRWEWRRTTECEVPGVVGFAQDSAQPTLAPDMGSGDPDGNVIPPAAGSSTDAPPAGALPPLDPLQPVR